MRAVHACCGWDGSRRHCAARATRRTFFWIAALLFVACTTATIANCAAMSVMGAQPMPGGWMLSNAWLPMCARTPRDFATSFLGMWFAMTAAMMLPSLAPALWRYREAVAARGAAHPDGLSILAGAAYFVVWSAVGLAVFLGGAGLTTAALREPALARMFPPAGAAVVLLAGVLQFSAWKARSLACCREPALPDHIATTSAWAAWQYGQRLGLRCISACAGLTAALLAFDVMDLRAMALVTVAITAERLAPDARLVTRMVGVAAIVIGLVSIAQAAVAA